MTILNAETKSCVVQTFIADGLHLTALIEQVDCELRDYINNMQADYWFIQNIQHTFTQVDGFHMYAVHLVMSRLYN